MLCQEEPGGLLDTVEDAEVGRLMEEMVTVQSVGTQYDVSEILGLPGSPPDASDQHADQVGNTAAAEPPSIGTVQTRTANWTASLFSLPGTCVQ